jgi:hypothetical protein
LKPITLSIRTLRRVAVAVLLAALCVALTGCGDSTTASASRAVNITYDEKLLFYKVEIDLTAVSHKEMGRQYAQAIVETLPQFERLTDAFLEKTLKESKMTFAQALEYANALKGNIPQEYMDEIEGMGLVFSYPSDEIGNGRLSPNKIFVSVIFQDVTEITACSASAVFGTGSATGRTIVGRNNDWDPDVDMDKWNALFIFHNGDRSIVGNGMIGELFPNNMFNRHHVFAAALDSSPAMAPSLPLKGIMRSPTADLRYAIETSRTLAEAEKFISERNYALGSLILMADADTAHVLEYDISRPEGQRARIRLDTSTLIPAVSWDTPNAIVSVNSYLLPGGFANHVGDAHNTLRFDSFRKLFSGLAAEGPIGVEQMQGIMGYTSWDGNAGTSGAIFRLEGGVITFQSLIVRLDTFETWLAYSAHGARWPYTPVYYKLLDGDPFRK